MRITLVLLALTLGLVGCGAGPLNQYTHRERQTAPQNDKQVGLLVSAVDESEMAELLKAEPTAEFRALNGQHGLYEVYGLNEEQIQTHIRTAQISRNDFIPKQQFDFKPLADEGIPGFKPCMKNEEAPDVMISSPDQVEDGSVIELGKTLHFASDKSTPHEEHKSKLKFAWAIQAPERSALNDQVRAEDNLEIKPDAMGLYQILLIAQDDRNVCAGMVITLVVSSNAPMKAPTVDDSLKNLDLSLFSHIGMIHAEKSWELSQGAGVTIAVLDTGVNYNHPLLAANIAINKKEIPDNGIDDDKNGFIDDVFGYDFANKDAFPYDDDGHGTHVAGLAAGVKFGMAQKAKILPVKALGPMGGDIGSIVAAIYYAVDQGAQVLNMSFGNYGKGHPKLFEALDYAEKKNVIVMAASGNGEPTTGTPVNTDRTPNYPSAAKNKNIISVAASSKNSVLSSYSNYGVKSVDIVLPGGDTDDQIVSCAFENAKGDLFEKMMGTSMATPIASGLVAQMLSLNPKLTPEEVREILMSVGPVKKELKSLIGSGRHVDAEEALLKVKGVSAQLLM